MALFPILALRLQQATSPGGAVSASTGVEWMPVMSFVVPAVLLIVLLYIGRKTTV